MWCVWGGSTCRIPTSLTPVLSHFDFFVLRRALLGAAFVILRPALSIISRCSRWPLCSLLTLVCVAWEEGPGRRRLRALRLALGQVGQAPSTTPSSRWPGETSAGEKKRETRKTGKARETSKEVDSARAGRTGAQKRMRGTPRQEVRTTCWESRRQTPSRSRHGALEPSREL